MNLTEEALEELFDQASEAMAGESEPDQGPRKDPNVEASEFEAEMGIRFSAEGRRAFLALYEIFRGPNAPKAGDPFDPDVYAQFKVHFDVLLDAGDEDPGENSNAVH